MVEQPPCQRHGAIQKGYTPRKLAGELRTGNLPRRVMMSLSVRSGGKDC